jgi:hypothetical protein
MIVEIKESKLAVNYMVAIEDRGGKKRRLKAT